jgi:hypothetical protein
MVRWRWSGACPVRSCRRTNEWSRSQSSMSFEKSLDGMDGSMRCTLLYCGEAFQHFCALVWSFFLFFSATAALLASSGFFNSVGRLLSGLEVPLTASLASTSANSFPVTPLWPGTQKRVMSTPSNSLLILLICLSKASRSVWEEEGSALGMA